MRFHTKWLVLLIVICVASAELQGPPTDAKSKDSSDEKHKSSNDRKADEPSDSDVSVAEELNENGRTPEEEDLAAILAEELSLHGSAIKVVNPSHLAKDKDAQKVNEMFTTIVNSHVKLIKKLEDEIEVMDDSIAAMSANEEPEKLPTPEEIELDNLYHSAMKILNRTKSDKETGFTMLKQAAERGHAKAQAKIAWSQLIGTPVEMNFEEAKQTFLRLAEEGLPDAHMVSCK